jgi:hypothetical protein
MRTFEEVLNHTGRISVAQVTDDGFNGEIALPLWRGSFIASIGAGWDHVSVRPYKNRITPSWDDMKMVKEIFFNPDEVAIQIHPAEGENVNNAENCLHLWRCRYKDQPLPSWALVGVKDGATASDLREELKRAYEEAGEHFNGI